MDFLSSDEITKYGPGYNDPIDGNGFEYQRLLYIFDVIKNAAEEGCFTSVHISGIKEPDYLVKRFFEEGVSLIREKGEGFPDVTFVSKNYVTISDVCRVDASKPIEKAGKLHGSSFEYFIANHSSEIRDWCEDELEEQLLKSRVIFSCGQLAKNICTAIEKKNNKIQRYYRAVSQYLEPKDRLKTFEVWLVLEDVTPTSDRDTVDSVMNNLNKSDLEIAGIIYVHDVGIGKLPTTIDDIKIYRLACR